MTRDEAYNYLRVSGMSAEQIKTVVEALQPGPCEDAISRQVAIDAIESTDWYHINKNGELVSGANSQEDEPLYKAKDIYKVLEKLPSVQPETCGDVISRKWLLECVEANGFGFSERDVNILVHLIRDTAPSVQTERKTGKWIKKDCDLLYCSECDLPSMHPWPYCERCGAKMGNGGGAG